MKFGHIEIFVREPLKAMDFYINVLGFELVEIQNECVVWVKSGETEILLRPGRNTSEHPTYQQSASGFVLYTDDMETTTQTLKEKGLTFCGTDGSEKCLTFTDPDGNWFQLVDPRHH